MKTFYPHGTAIMAAQLRELTAKNDVRDATDSPASRHPTPASSDSASPAAPTGEAPEHVGWGGGGAGGVWSEVSDAALAEFMRRERAQAGGDSEAHHGTIDSGMLAIEQRVQEALRDEKAKSADPTRIPLIDTGLERVEDIEGVAWGTVTNVLGRSSTFEVAKAQAGMKPITSPEMSDTQDTDLSLILKQLKAIGEQLDAANERLQLSNERAAAKRAPESKTTRSRKSVHARARRMAVRRPAPVRVTKQAEPQPVQTGLGRIVKRWDDYAGVHEES